ncbi:hypothetical protein GA0074694_2786 [Micromonospora inyonensis]|uniref:DUF8213 domain-containing protein n=1 Tax=Micromonospora inyonensis TaxID=47866 RepID=A0A1C6RRQ3_9ACTN|nr:hypothetical protein GA0074694_2786 [Micromonospora inyonensis]
MGECMKRRISSPLRLSKILVVGAALLLVTPPVTSAASAAPVAEPLASNDFRITASSASHDTGTFARSATVIEFAASAESAVSTEVTLSVGGKKFTASKDIASGSAQWSGEGAALQPDENLALDAFAKALESEWVEPASATKAPISLHRDLTIRLAMLLAEAPPGTRIGTQAVPRPAERYGDRKLPEGAAKVESCLKEGLFATVKDSAERRAVIAACQESNEDGIWYTGCNVNELVLHDADSHCFLGETVYVGPASYDCMGKCGGGCFIITGYTYDCADHDRCGRVHGGSTDPWDSECGDEYWEADDDFLWSTNQCG